MNNEFYLYLQVNTISIILIVVMFINNVKLYKMVINDALNKLLLVTLLANLFEFVWMYSSEFGGLGLIPLSIAIGMEGLFLALASALLSKYFLHLLDKNIKNKVVDILVFYVPAFIIGIVTIIECVRGRVDLLSGAHENLAYTLARTSIVFGYLFVSLFVSLISLIKNRKNNDNLKEISKKGFVGSLLLLAYMILPYFSIDLEYTSGALPYALTLFYLTSHTNTYTLVTDSIRAEKLKGEMETATSIQGSMLPNNFDEIYDECGIELYASMRPAKEVGGDFYDFYMLDDDHIAFIISDVSGKGVPAALFMAISKSILRSNAKKIQEPNRIFGITNNDLSENNTEMMFVTSWIGILEISTGILRCSNAGHEFPVIKRANGSFELYKDKHGMGLGTFKNAPYSTYEIQLNKGDTIYVYTDGIAEATAHGDVLFGLDRMIDALNLYKDKDPKGIIEGITNEIDKFVGNEPQFDDMTMLSFTYEGPSQI